MLAMGSEASLQSKTVIEQLWGTIAEKRLESVVVPKTGHWLGDEKPSVGCTRYLSY